MWSRGIRMAAGSWSSQRWQFNPKSSYGKTSENLQPSPMTAARDQRYSPDRALYFVSARILNRYHLLERNWIMKRLCVMLGLAFAASSATAQAQDHSMTVHWDDIVGVI